MSDKVVNDSAAFAVSIAERRDRNTELAESLVREGTSVADRQALWDNVVDLVTPSRGALLGDVDGRMVVVGPQDAAREVQLRTADATVVEHDLGFFGSLRDGATAD